MSIRAPRRFALRCCSPASPPARSSAERIAFPRAAAAGRADRLVRAISNEDARDSVGEFETVMRPRRDRGRACRSPTSAPARAIIRSGCRRWSAARAACSPRTSCPRRSATRSPSGSQRERLDNVAVKLGQPNDPQLPDALVRPDLHDPHVSRDRAAERVPLAPARRRSSATAGSSSSTPTGRPTGTARRRGCWSASSTRSATSSPGSSGCPTANPISPSSSRAARGPSRRTSRSARRRRDRRQAADQVHGAACELRSPSGDDRAQPLNPCATTYHSDEPLRLAGGLACLTVAKRRLSSATRSVSAPPASTLATKAPPGLQHLDGEFERRLDQAHRAQMVGLRMADRVRRHVGEDEVGRPAERLPAAAPAPPRP